MTSKFDYKLFTDVEFGDVHHWDYPDYCDAFIDNAEYDGKELSEEELDELNEDRDLVYQLLNDYLY
jgi:hypothetical protein